MKHLSFTKFVFGLLAMAITTGLSAQEACSDFRYYLADSPQGTSSSDIYGVEISDGNANLTFLASVDYQAHLGFNEETLELYIVNRNNGAFQTYDLGTSTLSAPTTLSSSLPNVAQAVVSPEGELIIGSETTNDVYVVDVLTGDVSPFPGESLTNINGGDFVYGADGTLYYASRNGGGTLVNVLTNAVVGNMPTNVTGAALTPDGNLLTSSRNFDDLRVYGPTGSATASAIYPTLLDGEPITVKPTDLASGCTDEELIEEGCYGAEMLYYNKGTGNVALNRQNPLQALGEPQRNSTQGAMNFVSLGFGGTLIIGFEESAIAGPGVDDLEIVETTWNNKTCTSYEERADLYVSQTQLMPGDDVLAVTDWVYVGQSCTNGASFDVYDATGGWEYFTMVKIVDASPVFGNRDGYDVDGIEALLGCAPRPEFVPEPGDCSAQEVLEYNPEGDLPENRTDETKVIGAPDRGDNLNFATLGFGGSIIIGFDGAAMTGDGDDLEVVETSFGNPSCASYEERADIYVSQQLVNDASEIDHSLFVLVGQSCTNGAFVDLANTPATAGWTYFRLVKLVDVTPESAQLSNRDGFDVDGFVALQNDCREVPTVDLEAVQGQNTATRISMDAFPNPTAGPVVIEFTTGIEQRVTVEVIDLNGRTIETLFNQSANADQNYRIDFSTSNLPNGIYLTKMTTDSEVMVKKVMVTR